MSAICGEMTKEELKAEIRRQIHQILTLSNPDKAKEELIDFAWNCWDKGWDEGCRDAIARKELEGTK